MTPGTRKMVRVFSGLGALFLTLLIALGFKIYYALKTDQPTMTEDYYRIGLDYDGYRASQRNSADRSLSFPALEAATGIAIGDNEIDVLYEELTPGNGRRPLGEADVQVVFSRRATVNEDLSGHCRTNVEGHCVLEVEIPAPGPWEYVIEARDQQGQLRHRGAIDL